MTLQEMGARAKKASRALAQAGALKDKALLEAAKALVAGQQEILEANREDVAAAQENGMSESLLDRLTLTESRIREMAEAVEDIAKEEDPVGKVLSGGVRPNGLKIEKVTVPLGVAGIIFEARPNVTSDAAALCLKAGNAVILRGGKEAFRSNRAVVAVLREAFEKAGLPGDAVQLVEDTSRASAKELMGLTEYLDVLIPRGGAGLIQAVVENAKVPVIETGVGNCHVYVDGNADVSMAVEIVFNGKTSRPSVCNAVETLLVHKAIAPQALPAISKRLSEKRVELRAEEKARAFLPDSVPASEEDFKTEFLDYILAVKVVDSLEEAVEHINRYSTGHSECIVTKSLESAEYFTSAVDSAAVYVNASTRFTDGGQFGLGAEIGISNQKLHARGPMGLAELTSYKYVVRGTGQVR